MRKKIQKLCDMYIDLKSQVQKNTKKNNNIAISFSKKIIIKSTVIPFKQSLFQHYTS